MREEVREEVVMLVFTQMGLCVLGTLLNNIVFITLKDLPGLRASTYNVMICHLPFVNLMVCTIIKPVIDLMSLQIICINLNIALFKCFGTFGIK